MMHKKIFLLSVCICIPVLLVACISPGLSSPSTSGIVSGNICYPSDDLPAMTLYFESTTDNRLISYQTREGQNSYSVELEPGTYYAYFWLPA